MYDLLSAQEIRKKLRVHFMKDVSVKAIHDVSQQLGYTSTRRGSKKGYDKSVYTALHRNWSKLLAYDKYLKDNKNTPNKPSNDDGINSEVDSNMPEFSGDYYMFNGEPDRVDYEWEIDDSVIREAINESIGRLLSEK